MKPTPLTPQPEGHHLPRLAPEFYRGFAVVQWTITVERRATSWLDSAIHPHFRVFLFHAAAREDLFCPAYVLMPDHLHLLWMGVRADNDQRNAMKFLRKHLAAVGTAHGVRLAAWNLNYKNKRMTACCGNKTGGVARLKNRAFTFSTIRLARNW